MPKIASRNCCVWHFSSEQERVVSRGAGELGGTCGCACRTSTSIPADALWHTLGVLGKLPALTHRGSLLRVVLLWNARTSCRSIKALHLFCQNMFRQRRHVLNFQFSVSGACCCTHGSDARSASSVTSVHILCNLTVAADSFGTNRSQQSIVTPIADVTD
jgi:hypothetical protein